MSCALEYFFRRTDRQRLSSVSESNTHQNSLIPCAYKLHLSKLPNFRLFPFGSYSIPNFKKFVLLRSTVFVHRKISFIALCELEA